MSQKTASITCIRCDSPITGSQCRFCKAWQISKQPSKEDGSALLSEITSAEETRFNVGPFNFVWSGKKDRGIVSTSETLLGGIPGAGKTTLVLQLADLFAELTGKETGLISAEMNKEELRLYADRLELKRLNRIRIIPALSGTVEVGDIIRSRPFGLVIVDSLQGLVGEDDEASIGVCKIMKQYASEFKTPVIVISQVNKEGDFAGLMKLQHAVDTLMTIECDEDGLRIIRVQKNRFGRAFIESTFQMIETGLHHIGDSIEEENGDEADSD